MSLLPLHPRSEAQIAASRANGALSQGPKDTSRNHLANLRHGFYAKSICLSSENQQMIAESIQRLEDLFAPTNDLEIQVIRELTAAEFHYSRALAVETAILETGLAETAVDLDNRFKSLNAPTRLAYAERYLQKSEPALALARQNLSRLRRETESCLRQLEYLQRRRFPRSSLSASGNIEIHTQQVVENKSADS